MSTDTALKHTPLHDQHAALGAKLVPFAGYEMPVQYVGVREEHEAVRTDVGVFDVSHMGQIETAGPGARDLLQLLISNDIDALAVGGAQYGLICQEDGGIIDDLFIYRLDSDRYLTVTNAANHEKDLAHFLHHAPEFDVAVSDRHDDYAMLAVQGPRARALVTSLVEGELPSRMQVAELELLDDAVLVCGTGYTGEDGVELLVAPAAAERVWKLLLAAGAKPCGLAARDTLRLEVCYHLYGNDMDETRNPIEAGLGWCCKEETGFIGSGVVREAREGGTAERLAAFAMTAGGIARQGNLVVGGGVVTSGTMSPSLGVGIGMAYLLSERAEPGGEFEIDVRGKVRPAVVKEKPLYHKDQ